MKLHASKFKRLVVVCADCEKRTSGPRHVDSKSAAKLLRDLGKEAPVRSRIARTRCLGLCPHKALAAVALGDALPAVSAEVTDGADLKVLAQYAFGPGTLKR